MLPVSPVLLMSKFQTILMMVSCEMDYIWEETLIQLSYSLDTFLFLPSQVKK